MEGNLHFKIGWAILIVGSKFIVFALFYFAYIILEGRFNAGFLALPVWGAYIWRGSFSELYLLRWTIILLFLNGRNTTVPNQRARENPGNPSLKDGGWD